MKWLTEDYSESAVTTTDGKRREKQRCAGGFSLQWLIARLTTCISVLVDRSVRLGHKRRRGRLVIDAYQPIDRDDCPTTRAVWLRRMRRVGYIYIHWFVSQPKAERRAPWLYERSPRKAITIFAQISNRPAPVDWWALELVARSLSVDWTGDCRPKSLYTVYRIVAPGQGSHWLFECPVLCCQILVVYIRAIRPYYGGLDIL